MLQRPTEGISVSCNEYLQLDSALLSALQEADTMHVFTVCALCEFSLNNRIRILQMEVGIDHCIFCIFSLARIIY